MKKTFIRCTTLVSVAILVALASGCASVAVKDDVIERNTATTLGLDKGSFTISDRVNDGIKSSYTVKTNEGRQYSCYVTGMVTYFGRTVSDAICTEVRKPGKTAPSTGKSSGSCNALLKAAGKC